MPINEPIETPGTPQTRGWGHFTAGQEVLFYFDFPDLDGILYDPVDIDVNIYDPDDTAVLEKEAIDKIQTGQYAFSWTIPADSTPGLYTIELVYLVETISGEETKTYSETFTIGEEPAKATSSRSLVLRAYLEEAMLGYAQRIPVFDEIARLNQARTIAKLTFPRWNQPAGVEVKVNGELKESGYAVNYLKGVVTFDYPLTEIDEVNVNYNFRWFTDDELDAFVEEGINMVNLWPAQTGWNYATIPNSWVIASSHASAVLALRRLLMDLLFQEPQKVFGGPERADRILGHLDNLKKNYEEWLEKMLEQKKYGPYVGLTRTVVVPEYTLPGGRSRWFRYLFKGN